MSSTTATAAAHIPRRPSTCWTTRQRMRKASTERALSRTASVDSRSDDGGDAGDAGEDSFPEKRRWEASAMLHYHSGLVGEGTRLPNEKCPACEQVGHMYFIERNIRSGDEGSTFIYTCYGPGCSYVEKRN